MFESGKYDGFGVAGYKAVMGANEITARVVLIIGILQSCL
jgi:hypothetical protein